MPTTPLLTQPSPAQCGFFNASSPGSNARACKPASHYVPSMRVHVPSRESPVLRWSPAQHHQQPPQRPVNTAFATLSPTTDVCPTPSSHRPEDSDVIVVTASRNNVSAADVREETSAVQTSDFIDCQESSPVVEYAETLSKDLPAIHAPADVMSVVPLDKLPSAMDEAVITGTEEQSVDADNNNNNNQPQCLWCCHRDHGHCESSPGSFDECRLSAAWPPTLRPSQPTWAVSPPINGCYHPHPPSPFVIITQPES